MTDLFDFSPDAGLIGLAISAFLSATVLPGSSEAVLLAIFAQHAELFWPAVLVATLANTAGGMTSWWCGRVLPKWQRLERIPHKDKVERWGSPVLLLAWAPLIGDALSVAAGWLRLHWLPCCACMAIGKLARYWLVAQAATSM